ncbi:MAG: DUF58 domain-containing protein [Deltaproteobacteria bacterium]|nr:DUF58 domain-containing protein [Deltaproteobacteria bacterium]
MVNQAMAGSYLSVFKGQGMHFEEVRQYQPGDDVRTIDWNVSARTGDIFVKRFVEERELTVMLLVDTSASMGFGTMVREKRALAARLAALFAFSAIQNNDQVGLIMFSEEVELFVPPKKGRTHVLRLVREILEHRGSGRSTRIGRALEFLSRVTTRSCVAMLISDFIEPVEGYERELRIADRRHDLVPVVLADPAEQRLLDVGLCPFEDPETGEVIWVDTASRRVRNEFAERVADLRLQRDQLFRRHRIDFVAISTDMPYVQPLVSLLRKRARRAFH